MSLLRKGGVLVLAMVMLAGPAIACVATVAATPADKCCRPQPTLHCGAMQLPSAKSCCAAPTTPEQNSLGPRANTGQLHLPLLTHVPPSATHCLLCQRFTLGGDSPPESPPGSISILRF
jgi:hypothetical protein